jgi:hypothetical protein
MELVYEIGFVKSPDRFWMNMEPPPKSLSRDRFLILSGDDVLVVSPSEGSYHDVGREDGGEWIEDAVEFERP